MHRVQTDAEVQVLQFEGQAMQFSPDTKNPLVVSHTPHRPEGRILWATLLQAVQVE